MSVPVMRVAWYRFTTTLGRRWGGYLSLSLLIGLTGGIAMGSIAAARQTQSSFATFLASTNPSDLALTVEAPNLTGTLQKLPGVGRVEAALDTLNAFPLAPSGSTVIPPAYVSGKVAPIGSIDGEYFDQDRVAVVTGRMAAPERQDEFVMTVPAAHLLGWHIGEIIPFGFYTNAQSLSLKPKLRLDMKLVGTVVFNNEVVLDDVDQFPTYALFTPALTRQFSTGPEDVTYGLKLTRGARGVPAVETEIIQALPKGTTYSFHITSVVEAQVDSSVKPETIALAVFGGIAMLAALAISAQAIGRQLQEKDDETAVLRALGATRAVLVADGLLGVLGAIVLGSLVATGVAIGLSPLSPVGPVRPVYPARGLSVDGAVIGGGLLVLISGLGALAVGLTVRSVLTKHGRPRATVLTLRSRTVRLAANFGAPISAVTGTRFALEPGHGRASVPVRSVLFGNALAVAIVVATLTFGSGLATLVSHPRLYGWNWSYALSGYPVPTQSLSLLAHDHQVAAWSGVSFVNLELDGQTVPAILANPHAQVTAPVLSGHPLEADNQVVLGAATLAQLHKQIGDTVVASYGTARDAPVYVAPRSLVIVGTAPLPSVGMSQALHTSMGTGAIISTGNEPPAMRKFLRSPNPTLNGPIEVFVRLRKGVPPEAGLRSLQRVANAGTKAFEALPSDLYDGQSVAVLPVQYPAQIENYRSMADTPAYLASGLALAAVIALGLTLIASVRRRRRDLALLKALGFTSSQLGACVAWQSTVAVAVGVVVGAPSGVALGRWLWDLFAREIYAVPSATVPTLSLVYVGLGAFLLANAVAAIPGRYAARTPTALVLRTE